MDGEELDSYWERAYSAGMQDAKREVYNLLIGYSEGEISIAELYRKLDRFAYSES